MTTTTTTTSNNSEKPQTTINKRVGRRLKVMMSSNVWTTLVIVGLTKELWFFQMQEVLSSCRNVGVWNVSISLLSAGEIDVSWPIERNFIKHCHFNSLVKSFPSICVDFVSRMWVFPISQATTEIWTSSSNQRQFSDAPWLEIDVS